MVNGPGTVILTWATDLAHNAGHRVGVAGTVQAHARVVDVNALQCGGDAIGIALTPNFTVGDDVQTGIFLGADGQQGGIFHGLLQMWFCHAPQFFGPHAGWETTREFFAVDQPIRLGITADDGGGEKHGVSCE